MLAAQVKARLEATGLLRAIEAKKRVFFEPRSSAAVESVLAGYSDACNPVDHSGPAGALLLSVVGGKMSEGINFGDGLGRCGFPVMDVSPPPCPFRDLFVISSWHMPAAWEMFDPSTN